MRKFYGKIVWIFGLLYICMSMGAAGCGSGREKTPDQFTVGVVYYDKSDTFLNALVEVLKELFRGYEEDAGKAINVRIRSSEGSQKLQNAQVQELIDNGCDVLCINLVDRADPSNIIEAAKENDVPIVFFNREPVEDDMKRWEKLYYVGADAKQSGQYQGELAAQYLEDPEHTVDRNRDGIIQYVVLEGEMGHQDSIVRTESSVETLKEKGIVLEKLSYQIANWNRAQAQNRMEQMIGQYKNRIELVLANNDDMALGAIDAYKKLNYTEDSWPVFFGIDGTQVGLEAVADGRMAGTVYNDKEGQAEAIADLVMKLLKGEGIGRDLFEKGQYLYVPYQKVTDENLDSFAGGEK